MHLFRTIVELEDYNLSISHKNKIITMGSCFAENIGGRLTDNRFDICINPFGILYNPASIAKSIDFLIDNKEFSSSDFQFNNGIYSCFDLHGKFSGIDIDKCIEVANNSIAEGRDYLQKSDVFIITFGTSWVYQLSDNNQIVSNCHKFPSKIFKRIRLTKDQIVNTYNQLNKKIRQINPNIQIIFTVSPIRHWKDGANGNQLSKAELLLAIEQICKENENAAYFPSYEIIMDELRDYRFYNEDMIHVSDTAVDYIWQRFSDAFFGNEAKELNKRINKIVKALNHRPVNPNTEQHTKFKMNLERKIIEFEKQYPYIKMNK
ncbi:MAG: GSCFA domain-containing protein [Marinifilaceae bacterium]|jgi:hypothetical protein|nr:GSCFA domain-containing protein [Marinifilaceae bacterium]